MIIADNDNYDESDAQNSVAAVFTDESVSAAPCGSQGCK